MERVRIYLNGRRWRKVITCFLTCCIFLNSSLPVVLADEVPGMIEGEDVVQGTASFNTAGNTTTIKTGGPGTIIEYTRFNIDELKTVNFAQPDPSSAVLNRVIEANKSLIDGKLMSNGRVFLVNPAGIMFGGTSTVNVTQLVASGLGMSNEAFNNYIADPVNNRMEFMNLEGGLEGEGQVTNDAVIEADSVYLIGKKVYNLRNIEKEDGLVVMAAGDEVRLFQNGSNVSVTVNTEGVGFGYPDILNSSNVRVNNGKIVLAAGDTLSRAISNVGTLAASAGEVEIHAALIENRGQIDVSVYPSSANGDGGSISLTGTEQVVIGPDGTPGKMNANAGVNGNGGTITINAPGTATVEGKVTIEENSSITANGGSGSGNGGSVTITSDNYEIAGDIDASFGNKMSGDLMSEPGRLEINSRNVIIADGANVGAMNTLYEDSIEALSQAGTSLILNAEEGITVKDITDDTGAGEITGRFGSIELHTTGENSAITFAKDDDTIRTTLGDIVIEAGSGGINVGNLITGKDLSEERPAPGQIELTTYNGGDITTGDLIIAGGWGHAEINVDSAGDLTVNGNVIVGEVGSPILTVPHASAAEAIIYLGADDNVVLNGLVQARAFGTEEAGDESITKTYIDIIAGRNHNLIGDAAINDDILAEATASSAGKADAIIKVDAWGNITFAEGAEAHAIAGDGAAEAGPGTVSEEDPENPDENVKDHAQIIINVPPPVPLDDNNISTPKATAVEINVLVNDIQGGAPLPLVDGAIDSYTEPTAGTLTPTKYDDKIVGFTYHPPVDLSTLTFNESGEAKVTFTYTVRNAYGIVSEKSAIVTITLINSLPTAIKDDVKTDFGKPFSGNVLTNDIDTDLDDVLKVVAGTITTKNGTLVLNADGTFTYTPNAGFAGTDKFTYSATDSLNTSSEVEVTITVSEGPPTQPSGPYIPPTPGLDRMKIETQTSGCPALVKWVAEEIGIDQRMVQIWISNSLASTGDIQPCDACAGLKNSAKILQDADGSHVAALAQVISQFASSNTPPTEEQMASIAEAIARNTDDDNNYAVAGEYLDALVTYIDVLNNDMGFSTVESIQFVTDKYVGRVAQGSNVGVATFIAASLAALGG